MNHEIENYNAAQSIVDGAICTLLMDEINRMLPNSKSKIWHGGPVWFIDDNPIVGYTKLKTGVQLLFWSGQTFDEDDLMPVGKFRAAEARYTNKDGINIVQLKQWLTKSIEIQWDYKNITKREGELIRL